MRLTLTGIAAIILCLSACGKTKEDTSAAKGTPDVDAIIAARRNSFLQARPLTSSDINANKNWRCNKRAAFGTSNYEENYWLNLSLADEPGLASIKKADIGSTTWQYISKAVIDGEFREIKQIRYDNGCLAHFSYVYRMTAEGGLTIEEGVRSADGRCSLITTTVPSIASPDTHSADMYIYCK